MHETGTGDNAVCRDEEYKRDQKLKEASCGTVQDATGLAEKLRARGCESGNSQEVRLPRNLNGKKARGERRGRQNRVTVGF